MSSLGWFPSLCALGDMYNQEGDATEPEWVKTEREQFTEFRDKNKDGRMDKDETRDWILPNDYDHAEAEAKHLVYESDADKVRSVKPATFNRNEFLLIPQGHKIPRKCEIDLSDAMVTKVS